MGGKDHRGVRIGDLVEFPHENGALPLQVFHHVFVMDDLVTHIDRRAMDRQRLLHRVDGTDDARAEAARGTEKNIEVRLRHDGAMWREEAPSVKRERRLFAGPAQVQVRCNGYFFPAFP
jgi:hypothetical protein